VLALVLAACAGPQTGGPSMTEPPPPSSGLVRLVLGGDVMMGRAAAPVASRDPGGVFEGVRWLIEGADVAAANLESPLTTASHLDPRRPALEADPAAARALGLAGFDLMAVANNHAGDAGPDAVLDTIAALVAAGVGAVGGGADPAAARASWSVDPGGIPVTFLAYDLTRAGPAAQPDRPGVAAWDEEAAEAAVTAAAASGLVVVSIHGGLEWLPEPDPGITGVAARVAGWGADLVWGHGAHVLQAVRVEHGTVVATSLGNLLFDQPGGSGGLLEVLADEQGVVAFRVGLTSDRSGLVRFLGWAPPAGDAVLLDGEWWEPARSVEPVAPGNSPEAPALIGDVDAIGEGDVDGDGRPELVAAFRRPARLSGVAEAWPGHLWVDERGRSAHLGVYRPASLEEVWVAGALARPVGDLAVCDRGLAVTYTGLTDRAPVAAGGWAWNGFGFKLAPDLLGPGSPGCADVDGDGLLDPLITGR
jgi:poly-gamma-glutamate synthesis protein (capsule biosynthesis protein)